MPDVSMGSRRRGRRPRIGFGRRGARSRMPLAGALLALAALSVVPATAGALRIERAGALFEFPPDGTAQHQQRIAVEHSTGNVFVTNDVADMVLVYAPGPTGATFLTAFGAGQLSDPFGIAIDQRDGSVYVSDAGNARIVRYTVTPGSPPTYTLDAAFAGPQQGTAEGEIGDFAAPLAVDASSDTLVVADPGNGAVKRFTLAGDYDDLAFDGADSPDGAFTGLLDVAVDSTGDIIVVDENGEVSGGPPAWSRVLRFDSGGAYEDRVGPALQEPATVAVRPVDDQVFVTWDQDVVMTNGSPKVTRFDSAGAELGSFELPASVAYSVATGIALDDGSSGRLYVGTDVDRSFFGGAFGAWSVQAYDLIPPGPPAISEQAASDVTPTSARLSATLLTDGEPTTYWFEYGVAGTGFPLRTASVSPPVSFDPQSVSAEISGLAANTAYELRLVADNGVGGPVAGRTVAFDTLPLLPVASLGTPSSVSQDAAVLHGTIDVQEAPGTYGFSVVEVGGGFNTLLPAVDVPATPGPVAVSAPIQGLAPGKTYRVGLYIHTTGGTVYADPVTFTTALRAVAATPPRQGDDGRTPYGCDAPRLDPVGGAVRSGQELVVTGSDLGVHGTVEIGGHYAEVRSYARDRVTVVVPDDVRGRPRLTLDCGKAAEPIAVTIVGARSAVRPKVESAMVRGSSATLRVRVPGGGTIRASGRHLRNSSVRAAGSGAATVTVRLTRAGRRELARSRRGRLPVTIVIRYRSTDGASGVVRRKVVFRSSATSR